MVDMVPAVEIEARLRARTLPGLTGGGIVVPDYAEYSTCAIPGAVGHVLGLSLDERGPLTEAIAAAAARTGKRLLLLLIDGLGYLHLQELRARYPDLFLSRWIERGALIPITTTFPPTTVTALSSLSTGLTPLSHGMLGYRLFLKETAGITNMIRLSLLGNVRSDSALRAGIDLETFLGTPTFYQNLATNGVATHVVLARQIARSGLSTLLYAGSAHIRPAAGFPDMLVAARQILDRTPGDVLVTLYWGGVDGVAHHYGPFTEEADAEIRAADDALRRAFEGREADTLLLITADHGFVPMDERDYIDVSEDSDLMANLLLPPVGESRASYLYVKHGRKRAVTEHLVDRLGDRAVCIDAEQALESGLFGSGPENPQARDRIGDLVVVATDSVGLYYPYPDAARLRGMHGGLTAREMIVPLIVSHV